VSIASDRDRATGEMQERLAAAEAVIDTIWHFRSHGGDVFHANVCAAVDRYEELTGYCPLYPGNRHPLNKTGLSDWAGLR
jgi:hypothetical protein